MVRDKFYGSWWSDMGFMFRLTYFILQTLLTPFHSVVYQAFYIARYFDSGDHWFPEYARRRRVNLDLPLNRFISYTGWHLIFVLLVVFTALPSDHAWYTRGAGFKCLFIASLGLKSINDLVLATQPNEKLSL